VIAKLTYLYRRTSEAPFLIVFRKIWLRVSPWLRYPPYRFRSRTTAQASSVANLKTFGCALRASLDRTEDRWRTDLVLNGRFPCLGYGEGNIPAGRAWLADQFHDYQWAVDYFVRCDYLSLQSRCDVKVPWEYSRLQFLMWLAEGSTAPEIDGVSAFKQYRRISLDWIASNPVGFGVNWISSMEVAIRGVNLGIATAIFADNLDSDELSIIVGSLENHLQFIVRFPEVSDVSGNHYLANLLGVYVLSYLVRGPQDSSTLGHLDAFLSEAGQQFETDGVHLERAPTYHRLCLDMVALVIALEVRQGRRLTDGLIAILHRGLDFCEGISSADRRLPLFGDNDSGHVLWFGEDARSFATLKDFAAVLRGESIVVEATSSLTKWLVSLAGLQVSSTQVERTRGRKQVWRGDSFVAGHVDIASVVMRVGEQGLKGRASHDHDDSMSIWAFLSGRDFIVDAGCHSYTLDLDIRDSYIRSRAHNVVQPLDTDRYVPVAGSVFRSVRGAPVARKYSAREERLQVTLSAELDIAGTRFRRCLRKVGVSVASIQIVDEWEWVAFESAELLWHFGQGLIVVPSDAPHCVMIYDSCGTRVCMETSSEVGAKIELFDYAFSDVYGSSVQCKGLRFVMPSHSTNVVTTTFRLIAQ
jgi:hypothetical protein